MFVRVDITWAILSAKMLGARAGLTAAFLRNRDFRELPPTLRSSASCATSQQALLRILRVWLHEYTKRFEFRYSTSLLYSHVFAFGLLAWWL